MGPAFTVSRQQCQSLILPLMSRVALIRRKNHISYLCFVLICQPQILEITGQTKAKRHTNPIRPSEKTRVLRLLPTLRSTYRNSIEYYGVVSTTVWGDRLAGVVFYYTCGECRPCMGYLKHRNSMRIDKKKGRQEEEKEEEKGRREKEAPAASETTARYSPQKGKSVRARDHGPGTRQARRIRPDGQVPCTAPVPAV